MYVRMAAIVCGLLATTALAAAKDSKIHRPVTAHKEQAEKDSHKRGKDEAGSVAALDRDSAAALTNFPAESVGWHLVEDPATGARLGVPGKIVPRMTASRTGSRWTSAQGQIQIETFRLTEAALPALFEEEKKALHRQVSSSQLNSDSFVISGVQGLKNFRVRAAARGTEVRGVTVLYDQATEGTMDSVAAAVIGAFSGFPDHASPVPGIRRMVEYGTAIVVSGDGDLIAPAHVTDDCQSITLPGLGHAERIAVDKTTDLALIHVYGARNLVAAVFAADGGRGVDLTLVGVADPLTQAGAAEVTSTAAHRTAQGLDPAPKLGFSGAAAADSRGALAGMVDLNPPVVAGGGAPSQGATVVPVETIRVFLNGQAILKAQGMALGAVSDQAPAPMEQSVVRIACVRK